MKFNEIVKNLKDNLDTYNTIDVKWNHGCVQFHKSISNDEYSIQLNNCGANGIHYYRRYGNFIKDILKWDTVLDKELTYLSYGCKGRNNLNVIIEQNEVL